MKITFLGTGTSQGVPLIGCDCAVCQSPDEKDRRLRVSVLIEFPDLTLVIDSGPDFRYQMLRAGVKKLDALVFTHGHKDHTAGMDDIRAFNFFQNKPMDIYASMETQEIIKREFSYIFLNKDYPGIPRINLHNISNAPFIIKGHSIMPVRVLHLGLEVFGFRIGDFSYITDANFIDDEEKRKLKGVKVAVFNALREEPHPSHFNLREATALAKEIGAEKTFFTHLSHQMGLHQKVEAELPSTIRLAYDGLSITIV